jgi:hypothetical protein
LLDQVLVRLKTEVSSDGKHGIFERLKVFLVGEKSELSYAELAPQLALTEGALKVKVQRLRHRYRELLREEIGNTISIAREIDDEFRHLFAALSRG